MTGRRSPLELRRALVAATVALITLSALIIGIVSVVSVQSILMQRIDDQLTAATSRSTDAVDDGPELPPDGGASLGFLRTLGQTVGTLGAISVDGKIVAAGYLDASLDSPLLEPDQVSALEDADVGSTPTTVHLGSGLGNYRAVELDIEPHVSLIVGLPLADMEATVSQLVLAVVAVTVTALVLAGGGAYALVRLTLRPLDRVAATATAVSRMTLDRGEVALAVRVPDEEADGRTEVGRVGAAINRMLGHVSNALSARQASEERVRRFVSDASHELRTPLASIRGYAELTRMSGETLPDDAAYALGRIESESRRMTSIVEDLLLLARLDEGRQLESEPVDIGELIVDAVSDARAASADHEWVVDVPDRAIIVTGDRQRLFQVVMNLLANARVHTPAGTRVTAAADVGVSDGGAVAVVTIADDGPGIDPDVIDAVFERFVRADTSRTRATGSTGLGLAIVQGVTAAHGGTASVTSEPGRTVFRIELPLAS